MGFLFRLLLVNERAQSNMQKGWGIRHIIAIIILAGGCLDRVCWAFCETDKFSEVPNATQKTWRLYEVSPDEIALYTTFSDTRD